MSFSVYTQPTIPKNAIPKNISPAVRKNIEKLYSSDPVERGYGAYYLGNMGKQATPAIPFLIGILNDFSSLEWSLGGGYTSPGEEAARALGKIGKPAVKPLIAALKYEDEYIREQFAELLRQKGEPNVEAIIVALKKNEDKDVQWRAAEALGKIGKPAVEPLITVLKVDNEKWHVREYAARALGETGDARAVEPLIAALNYENVDIRERAAGALGKLGDARAVEPLIAALKDEDADVRDSVAYALGKIGDARAVEPLIAALKDEDTDVRWNAVEALGEIGDARAVEPLIVVLKDENWQVRGNAAKALGKIDDTRAVEPLIAALKDEDLGVRLNSEEALRTMTGRDFGEDQTKWQNWWNDNKGKMPKN